MAEESKLRIILKAEGWTKSALSRASGLSVKTIWKAENGHHLKGETLSTIVKGMNKMPSPKKQYELSDIC